jgi:predicted transglutaminase-like cysteine proteinase
VSIRLIALSLLSAAGCIWLSAEAANAGSPRASFSKFCAMQPKECQVRGDRVSAMPMSEKRWSELRRVNAEVNGSIRQVTDKQNHGRSDDWSLASNGKGDCEDFALLKRLAFLRAADHHSA